MSPYTLSGQFQVMRQSKKTPAPLVNFLKEQTLKRPVHARWDAVFIAGRFHLQDPSEIFNMKLVIIHAGLKLIQKFSNRSLSFTTLKTTR